VARILGPDGEPVSTPETEVQADRQKYGARSVTSHVDIDSLTPQRMKAYLTEAESGNIASQAAMFEKMEEKDGELDAHLRTRKSGVTRCEWNISPADDSPEAEEAAELCREVLDELRDLRKAVFDLLDAVPKGFSALEIDWETSADRWRPVDLIWRPQRWFTVADDGRTLRIRDGSVDGEEIPDLNFVIHRMQARSGFQARIGLMRSLTRAFIVRHFSWKDWMRFAEVYGMPPRIGRLREGVPWDSDEAESLWNAVRALGMDAAAVLRQGDEIETLDVSQAGEGEIFERIQDRAGKELVLAILGQTLTSGGEEGGSYALGEVHNQVRWDLLEEDARAVAETLEEQLLRPIVQLNLGDAPVPSWSWALEKPEDLGELADSVETLATAGARIPESWVYEKFGIPEPDGDESVLVPIQLQQAQAALSGGGAEGDGGEASEAANSVPARPRDALHQAEPASAPEGPLPEDGLAWMQEKRVVDEESWDELSPAGRQRAWWVSGVSRQSTAMAAQQLVEVLQGGDTQNDYLDRLEELGVSVPGGEEPGEGQIGAAQARLVHRQNRNSAYGADRYIKAQRTIDRRPYAQYHAVGDERTRPNHLALDGTVKPINAPFWASYWPPWAFNCRCSVTTLSQDELDAEGLSVATRPELAARYQAAKTMAPLNPSERQFRQGWQNLRPEYEGRDDIPDSLLPPDNDRWRFNRGDAYYLTGEGQEPATETGRADLDILRQFPAASEMI